MTRCTFSHSRDVRGWPAERRSRRGPARCSLHRDCGSSSRRGWCRRRPPYWAHCRSAPRSPSTAAPGHERPADRAGPSADSTWPARSRGPRSRCVSAARARVEPRRGRPSEAADPPGRPAPNTRRPVAGPTAGMTRRGTCGSRPTNEMAVWLQYPPKCGRPVGSLVSRGERGPGVIARRRAGPARSAGRSVGSAADPRAPPPAPRNGWPRSTAARRAAGGRASTGVSTAVTTCGCSQPSPS